MNDKREFNNYRFFLLYYYLKHNHIFNYKYKTIFHFVLRNAEGVVTVTEEELEVGGFVDCKQRKKN